MPAPEVFGSLCTERVGLLRVIRVSGRAGNTSVHVGNAPETGRNQRQLRARLGHAPSGALPNKRA